MTSAAPVSRSPQTTLKTPGGQELGHQLGHPDRAGGRRVGRLEHHRVAGRERRRPLPDRHHRRVVPRRHRRADADRLAPDERRVAAHVLAGRLALEHARRAREEADLVAHRRDLLRPRELASACRCSATRSRRAPRRAPRSRRRSAAARAGARSAWRRATPRTRARESWKAASMSASPDSGAVA